MRVMLREGKRRHEGSAIHRTWRILLFRELFKRAAFDPLFRFFVLLRSNVLQTQAGGIEGWLVANCADPAVVMPGDADGKVTVGEVHG